jgi:uncharacterized membrane protein
MEQGSQAAVGVAVPAPKDSPQAMRPSPATPTSPAAEGLTPVLARNIRSLQKHRTREEARASVAQRIVQVIGDFAGSMTSVFVHVSVFGAWILANLGFIPGLRPWDPEFVTLAMIASVEAIFLSTFVLITQNRMAAAAEKRADLDLQISLLAEHEVTRLVTMVSAIADKVGARTEVDHEIEELEKDVAPEKVLDELDELEESAKTK